MAILKYLGIAFYAALAARAETEKTPLVPLVSIRELHEDFSGKVEDAECERKPELVNSHEDVLVVFCLESPEDDWRCSVRYSDDDCTPDSDDECGDEDRRI